MNRLILVLAGLLALPAIAGCTPHGDVGMDAGSKDTGSKDAGSKDSGKAGASKGVQQQVQVDAQGGKVVVRLALENGGPAAVFAPKAVYVSDQIFRREFEITNKATGAEVDYTGPMVKRGPFTKDDFVAVKPGGKLNHSIDITRSYDFKPGTTYELRYGGSYLGDVARLDAPASTPVPPVTFTVK